MIQRIFGFGGAAPNGYYPNQGYGGKKILPTLGVSFGLPYPTNNYPISPYGNIPNPHFGAISPNGLNLGLLNVNPLFSLQVTKSEHGEKLVKPFVNLHVTPNEGIIGKIGHLFAAKKGHLHNHYHKHLHRYPPFGPYGPPGYHGPPHHFGGPILPHPPHFEGPILPYPPPPHFEGGPIFSKPPHHFHGPGPIFSKPPPFYKDSGHQQNELVYDDIAVNPNVLGFRSGNVTFNDESEFPPNDHFIDNLKNEALDHLLTKLNSIEDDDRYARQYSDFNRNSANLNNVQSIPAQAPGNAQGSEMVSFPTSRRRRDTDQVVPASIEKKESLESVDEDDSEDSEGRGFAGKVHDMKIYVWATFIDLYFNRDKLFTNKMDCSSSNNRNNVGHEPCAADDHTVLLLNNHLLASNSRINTTDVE